MNNITDELLQNILSKLQDRLEELETELVPKVTYKVLGSFGNDEYLHEAISKETFIELFEKLQIASEEDGNLIEIYTTETNLVPRNSRQVSSEFNNVPTTRIIVNMLKDAGLIDPTALWRHNYNYDCYEMVKQNDLKSLKNLVDYQINHTFKPITFA